MPNEYSSITEVLGVDPSFIHLEITESTLSDYTVFEKQIRLMTEKGFLFVLDDYGKGYSNLMRLKSCPFINVKLDMDVVRSYCKEPGNIIPNTVNSFKSMGFKVTAEGIETAAMADAMYNIGCDYLQGFYNITYEHYFTDRMMALVPKISKQYKNVPLAMIVYQYNNVRYSVSFNIYSKSE